MRGQQGLLVVLLLVQAPGWFVLCQVVPPATHLSCYDDRTGGGCVPCSEQSPQHYQDRPTHDQPCKICLEGHQLEWNAQPSAGIVATPATSMDLANREIAVGALDAGYAVGDTVSIRNVGGGCDNGAAGVYRIESIAGNAVRLATPGGTEWPDGVAWSANPTTAADCTLERPGPGRTGCYPCGGFVAWDEDPDAFLASAQAILKPYIGKTDLDKNPATVCVGCTVRGRYAPLGHTVSGSNYNICLECESGRTDGDNDARTECEPCDAGTYAPVGAACTYCPRGQFDHDVDPSTPCERCPAGAVAVVEKSTECTVCDPGQYTDDNRWMCLDCVAGWYDHDGLPSTPCLICLAGSESVRETAAVLCVQCIEGRYAPVNGTVSCIYCDIGQYAPHNAVECVDCQPGYADVVRDPSVPCEACNIGDYTGHRALNCTACAAGTRDHDSNPSTQCATCAGGFYSDQGQTECIGCESGSFALPSAASCTLCAPGKFSVVEASECTDCGMGQYAGRGSTECSDCAIGQYDDDFEPATLCKICPEGTYSPVASTLCAECEEGEYDHDASAATPCQLCPRGRYDVRYGDPDPFDEPEPRTSCTMCSRGQYLDRLGSTTKLDCTECEEHTWAEEGFATCSQCPASLNRHNTYVLTRNRTQQSISENPRYKRGATGMVACVCDDGHFAPRKHVGQDWECTACPLRESCPGGSADRPRGTCADGYGGEWCQSCDKGHFKYEFECIECPEDAIYRVLWFVVAMLFFVGFMIWVAGWVREEEMAGGNNFFRAAITPMVIVVNRAQAYGAITNLDADWPNFVRKAALIVLHMANVDLPSIVYPECQIDFVTPAGVLLFRIAFNAVLYLMVCLFVFILFLIYIRLPDTDYAPLINGVVGCYCVLFILLIRVAFRSFDCTHNKDGNWYMDVNPDVRCFTPEFWPIFGVGLAMLAIYLVLVPTLFWWQLPNHDLQDSDTTKKFGWLYARYRPSVYFYEWVIMAQKVLLAGATTFVSSRKRLGVACALCLFITVGSLVLQLRLMPFNEWRLIEKQNEKPQRINLAAVDEDSELTGRDLIQHQEQKLQLCKRPPKPTREEQLEGEWRPWKWFGMNATEPPGELVKKLMSRWVHCFTYPLSLNSLEVIGLTVQIVVIIFALYFGYVADQSGECTLDGFDPTEVGFPAAKTEEACLRLKAASGSSGLWTKLPPDGRPRNIAIATLALPSLFCLVAVIMISINTRAYFKQRAEELKQQNLTVARTRFKSAGQSVLGAIAVGAFKTFRRPADLPGRPSSAIVNKPGEMTAAEKVNTWHGIADSLRRRNSTPSGEPKSMTINSIDLLCTYGLSLRVKSRYTSERSNLLGNRSSKGTPNVGKITQMQLGKGKGIEQLMPADQARLRFLQWRLAEDKLIKAELAKLEEERLGVAVEQEEAEEPLRNGVWKMIFVLKFISKTYGPMARNRSLFERELRDAQRRTRRAKKRFKSMADLVQKTSGSLRASSLRESSTAAGGHGLPHEAWGMAFATVKEGRRSGGREKNGGDEDRPAQESQGNSRSRKRNKIRRSKSSQSATAPTDDDGDGFRSIAPDS